MRLYKGKISSTNRSVFLTIWHCNLSAELIKTHFFRLFFGDFGVEIGGVYMRGEGNSNGSKIQRRREIVPVYMILSMQRFSRRT